MSFYVLAMPIGHAADISARALDVLRRADLILAEDTAKSAKLLSVYGIKTKARLRRCDAHTEETLAVGNRIEDLIGKNDSVVLISDAGSPTVSDPGRKLVAGMHQKEVPVIPIPGASAAVAALSVSGFSGDRFSFAGYPPRHKKERLAYFVKIKKRCETVIFYEAARRLVSCLEDMQTVFGKDRLVFFAHDMTKVHESFFRGELWKLKQDIAPFVKGEVTLVVKGEKQDADSDTLADPGENLLRSILSDVPPGRAAEIAAQFGRNGRNYYYRLALGLDNGENE